MAEVVVKKSNKLGAKVWTSIVLFGLMGQLAWMVENMYFSTYIQRMITSNPWATSATVMASAIVAAIVTIFGGVLSDRLGKRRIFICWGYIIWGLVTAAFGIFDAASREDIIAVVVIFVVMDCVMTVFGSMSNDAAFSSWVTDVTDITNRGFVEIILSIMPVAALMLIFAVFDPLTQPQYNEAGELIRPAMWWLFFLILGGITAISGVVGLFILKDSPNLKPDKSGKYLSEVAYGFKKENIKKHKMIYICLIGMMLSGLAMQMWQPYMIQLLMYTLGFGGNFVIPLAVVVLLSAGIAVAGGKLMDKYGKDKFFYPVAAIGVVGGLLVYLIKFISGNSVAVWIMFILGGTMIEGASLLTAGLFNATARDYTPEDKAGCFQGIRIVIYVTLPMILASLICPLVINVFGPLITEWNVAPAPGYFPIPSDSGYELATEIVSKGWFYDLFVAGSTSRVYPFEMFLFSAVAAAFVFIPTFFVHRENKKFRAEKLAQLNADVTEVDAVNVDNDVQTATADEQIAVASEAPDQAANESASAEGSTDNEN